MGLSVWRETSKKLTVYRVCYTPIETLNVELTRSLFGRTILFRMVYLTESLLHNNADQAWYLCQIFKTFIILPCGGDSVISRKLWICDQQRCTASSSYLTSLYSLANSYKTLQNRCRGLRRATRTAFLSPLQYDFSCCVASCLSAA